MLGHVGGRGGSLNVVITALLSFSLNPFSLFTPAEDMHKVADYNGK
jgi:hypothetical protein